MLLGLALSLSLVQASGTGIVRDQTGGAVPGASISVRSGSGIDEVTVSGPDGRFVLEKAPDGQATLVVRAVGFAVKEQPFSGGGDIEVVLEPATILETVTVTAARTEERLGNIPASISVLDRADIRQSPAVVADDVLRQLPTFSLFRRTSSLSSHPTAQGVSLRGIGPSGVSRTLVLIDSVPFNDPFGGWVYWTRVPLDSVDRIEVVDGASSSLYGNYAMGGVINIISGRPARRSAELSTQYGNLNSPKLDFRGSDVWGKVGAAIDGGWFNTDGFPIVAAGERGPVDTKATVEFRNLNVKVDYNPTSRFSAFVRGGYFSEERDNAKKSTFDGTPEGNDTTWKSASGGVRILLPDQSDLQGRVFADVATFRSNFLAVPNPVTRAIGRMTLDQRVPTKGFGGMVQWSRAMRHAAPLHGGNRLALGRRRQQRGRPRRDDRPDLQPEADFRRHAAKRRRVRPGRVDPRRSPDGDAQRARRSAGGTTTRTISRPRCPPARRRRTTIRTCPRRATPSPARAPRRCTGSPTR